MKQLTILITMLLCAARLWAQQTASQTDAYTDQMWVGVTGPVKRIVVVVPDANGNLIVSDTSYSGSCYVSWVPRWTGNFIIKVINRGNVYNDYVLITN